MNGDTARILGDMASMMMIGDFVGGLIRGCLFKHFIDKKKIIFNKV